MGEWDRNPPQVAVRATTVPTISVFMPLCNLTLADVSRSSRVPVADQGGAAAAIVGRFGSARTFGLKRWIEAADKEIEAIVTTFSTLTLTLTLTSLDLSCCSNVKCITRKKTKKLAFMIASPSRAVCFVCVCVFVLAGLRGSRLVCRRQIVQDRLLLVLVGFRGHSTVAAVAELVLSRVHSGIQICFTP
jgi:uncharacterized membrane protein